MKNRFKAAALAIFLGGFGAHKFYCNDSHMGIIYLMLFWTGVPFLISLVEGILYLICKDNKIFTEKYCKNMIIKVVLSEDILKLISNIHFERLPEVGPDDKYKNSRWAIDLNSLYGGSYLYEDIALILGRYNDHIEGTEDDPDGMRFDPEFENYMYDIHKYVLDNLSYIEELVHNFCNKGGLKPGTYTCKSYEHIWEYVN